MATARDIVEQAFKKLGVMTEGKTLSAYDAQSGLDAFNNLVSSWSEEGLPIPNRTEVQVTVTAAQSSYTIGSGGDFAIDWPVEIESLYLRRNGVDYTIVPIDKKTYDRFSPKDTEGIPDWFYYELKYPLGIIYFELRPSVNDVLNFTNLVPISEAADLSTTLNLPLAYNRALIWNTALELEPEYPTSGTAFQKLNNRAEESKRVIINRRASARWRRLFMDLLLPRTYRSYDIYSDRLR